MLQRGQTGLSVVSLTKHNLQWKVEAKLPIILVVKIAVKVDLRDREDNLQDVNITDREGPRDGRTPSHRPQVPVPSRVFSE